MGHKGGERRQRREQNYKEGQNDEEKGKIKIRRESEDYRE
jgi:hypothetical protein